MSHALIEEGPRRAGGGRGGSGEPEESARALAFAGPSDARPPGPAAAAAAERGFGLQAPAARRPAEGGAEVEFSKSWPTEVLYMYAGEGRRADWERWLAGAGAQRGIQVHGYDLRALGSTDAVEGGRRAEVMEEVRKGRFALIWIESPYESWTRALYRSHDGPRPVRSR